MGDKCDHGYSHCHSSLSACSMLAGNTTATSACLALSRYLVPGGSAAHYKRDGYTFDVGSSMMFGFGEQGTTNLITKALAAVGKRMETIPDPSQVHYHLPASKQHPQVGHMQLTCQVACCLAAVEAASLSTPHATPCAMRMLDTQRPHRHSWCTAQLLQ
jgi:hypothetical protein